LDDDGSSLTRFAYDLRKLREEAGSPPYRDLAKRAHYSSTTLSDAASGRRLPSLAVTLAFVAACNGDQDEWESRWHGLAAELNDVGRSPERIYNAPYVGLSAYRPEDAQWFFGRERLVDDLKQRLTRQRFLAVFGPSGVGKSSVIRAGLVSKLRSGQGTGPVVLFTPGAHPIRECAVHLAPLLGTTAIAVDADLRAAPDALPSLSRQLLVDLPATAETVFVIDQFEEIFTLCGDPGERAVFLSLLLNAIAPGSRCRVVLGVRADFYSHCAQHADLAAALQDAQIVVGPMTADELRRAITLPAHTAGCAVESDLLSVLVAHTHGQAGALPLLSHALLETWRRRRGNTLTLAGYLATGGVLAAVAQTADRAYAVLTEEQQLAAKRVLLRLIALGEDTEDTRRRVSSAEFDADPHTTAALDELVRARLVTLGDNTVEITHEALIRNWPTLRGWIDEDRETLLAQRRLTDAAAEWERSGRDEEYLYRRSRLTAWEDRDLDRLNDSERALLEASKQRQAQEEAATRRRIRLTLIGAGVVVVVVSLLSVLALVYAGRATSERDLAYSRQLVANARTQLMLDPELALLLARQAYRTVPTPEAEVMLRQATLDSRVLATVRADQRQVYSVAFSPDRRHVVSAGTDGTVRVWKRAGASVDQSRSAVVPGYQREAAKLAFASSGSRLASAGDEGVIRVRDLVNDQELLLQGHLGAVRGVVFDAADKRLASAGDDGTVRVWDAHTGREVAVFRGHQGPVWSVAFDGDGRVVSGGEDGTVRVWNAGNGREDTVIRAHDDTVKRLALSRNGRLATGSDDGTVKVWKGLGQDDPRVLRGHEGTVETLAFSSDGRTVASGGQDSAIRVWNVDGSVDPLTLRGHRGVVWDVAYDPDVPSRLASAGSDGTIRFWDVTAPGDPIVFRGHSGRVAPAELSPDGQRLVTGGRDTTVRVWRADGDDSPVVLRGHDGEVWDATFSPDGGRVASSSQDGTIRVWNLASGGEAIVLRGHQGDVWDVAFSPDGRHLASAGDDGTVRVWTTNHGDMPTVLRGHEGAVYDVSYSPDGSRLSSAGVDGAVRIWDPAGIREPAVLPAHQGGARSAEFGPDGQRLTTASADGTVRIWRSITDEDPVVLEGHQGPVVTATFSPDGRHLATNGSDGTVRIWKTDGTGDSVVIRGFGTTVSLLTFAPDGRGLVTGHGDGTARISRCEPCAPINETLELAETRTIRDFTPQERKTFLNGPTES
jgi:WD40 repeat protein